MAVAWRNSDLNNFNYLKTEALEAAVYQASQFEYASNNLWKIQPRSFILKLRKSLKDQEWNNVE